jgi:hypothetical protein
MNDEVVPTPEMEVVTGTPTKPSLGGISGVNGAADGGETVWVTVMTDWVTVTISGVGHVQDGKADKDAVRPGALLSDS